MDYLIDDTDVKNEQNCEAEENTKKNSFVRSWNMEPATASWMIDKPNMILGIRG